MAKYGIEYIDKYISDFIDKIEYGTYALKKLPPYKEKNDDEKKIRSIQIEILSYYMVKYEEKIRSMSVELRNDKIKRDARTLSLSLQRVYPEVSREEAYDKCLTYLLKDETVFIKNSEFFDKYVGKAFSCFLRFYIEEFNTLGYDKNFIKLDLSETLMEKIEVAKKEYIIKTTKKQEEKRLRDLEREQNKLTIEKYIKMINKAIEIVDSNEEYLEKEEDRNKIVLSLQKFISDAMFAYSRFSLSQNNTRLKNLEEQLTNDIWNCGVNKNSARKRAKALLNDPYIDANDLDYVKTNVGHEFEAITKFFASILEPSIMDKLLNEQKLNFSNFLSKKF